MKDEANEPERVTPSREKEEERPKKPRGREAEGTWANLIKVRKNAQGG